MDPIMRRAVAAQLFRNLTNKWYEGYKLYKAGPFDYGSQYYDAIYEVVQSQSWVEAYIFV